MLNALNHKKQTVADMAVYYTEIKHVIYEWKRKQNIPPPKDWAGRGATISEDHYWNRRKHQRETNNGLGPGVTGGNGHEPERRERSLRIWKSRAGSSQHQGQNRAPGGTGTGRVNGDGTWDVGGTWRVNGAWVG